MRQNKIQQRCEGTVNLEICFTIPTANSLLESNSSQSVLSGTLWGGPKNLSEVPEVRATVIIILTHHAPVFPLVTCTDEQGQGWLKPQAPQHTWQLHRTVQQSTVFTPCTCRRKGRKNQCDLEMSLLNKPLMLNPNPSYVPF